MSDDDMVDVAGEYGALWQLVRHQPGFPACPNREAVTLLQATQHGMAFHSWPYVCCNHCHTEAVQMTRNDAVRLGYIKKERDDERRRR